MVLVLRHLDAFRGDKGVEQQGEFPFRMVGEDAVGAERREAALLQLGVVVPHEDLEDAAGAETPLHPSDAGEDFLDDEPLRLGERGGHA